MSGELQRLTELLQTAREVADGLHDLDDVERQTLADDVAKQMRRCGAPVADVVWSTPVDLSIELVPRANA